MNIMLNSYCNLKCPYCFADNEINLCDDKTMSEENFDECLDFLINNGIKEVRIIGGEPTIHPYFGYFLNKIIDRNFFKHIHIFSNMNFTEEVRDLLILLSERIEISMLPNFNSELINKNNFNNAKDNIKLMVKYGLVNTIGVNLYNPNMNLSYFYDLISELKDNHKIDVRWSITVPPHTLDDNFDFKGYFNSFYNLLIDFFTILNTLGIKNHMDCNSIPMCAFTKEQIGELVYRKPDLFSKPTKCNPVIDVNPKLEVFRCFGLSGKYKTTLHKNKSLNQVRNEIIDNTEHLVELKVLNECKYCELYKINGSSCSCIAYRKEK